MSEEKIWDRVKPGRPATFESPDVLWEECIKYFEWVEDNPLYEGKLVSFQGHSTIVAVPKMRAMTIQGMCLFLNLSLSTWQGWRETERQPRTPFSGVLEQAEEIIRKQKFEGAAAELLNPNIIARDLNLKEHTDLSSEDGSMSPPSRIERIIVDPKEKTE